MSEARPGSVATTELVDYLDAYLEAASVEDFGPNGLQVEGPERVRRVVTGVSACRELFRRARSANADLVLVHHGLFWRGDDPTLVGVRYWRIRELVEGGLALAAYHLPLDGHPLLGNNALAARRLGLGDLAPFAEHGGMAIGVRGRFDPALPVEDLTARCSEVFGQEPLLLGGGPERVRSLGIVSGAATRTLHEAISLGLDAFLTGEATEWVTNLAQEAGIHYFACGHHATERLGIRALGEHLAEKFGLEVEFVDVANPV